jgi:hypothetical protein
MTSKCHGLHEVIVYPLMSLRFVLFVQSLVFCSVFCVLLFVLLSFWVVCYSKTSDFWLQPFYWKCLFEGNENAWRYQRVNRKKDTQYNGEREKGQNDKQWSTKHYTENKDTFSVNSGIILCTCVYLLIFIGFVLCKTSHNHSMSMFKSRPYWFEYSIWQTGKLLAFSSMLWVVLLSNAVTYLWLSITIQWWKRKRSKW